MQREIGTFKIFQHCVALCELEEKHGVNLENNGTLIFCPVTLEMTGQLR